MGRSALAGWRTFGSAAWSEVQHALRARAKTRARVGWVAAPWQPGQALRRWDLDDYNRIRGDVVRRWIERIAPDVRSELYRPGARYDVVVFNKVMDSASQEEVASLRARGTRIVFDANVNYYEEWGDYFVSGTRPTEQQRADAIRMTQLADWVVADSTYLRDVVARFSERVSWIPDAVDLERYRGGKIHRPRDPVVLIWAGVAKKAEHLRAFMEVWPRVRSVELVLAAEREPAILAELNGVVRCHFVRYREYRYPELLLEADIIISPKRLVNAYEMAHTEYKLALGMAQGLPAVGSPQRSYCDAIERWGGGRIAHDEDEWARSLAELVADHALRQEVGNEARRVVIEHYSAPVIAAQYLAVIEKLL